MMTLSKYGILLLVLGSFSFQKNDKITVYLIGDSTIANKAISAFPETGWGMPFAHMFDSSVVVDNRAKNGRSTRTFISENLWQPVADKLQAGDYVFIQFGHNDESKEKTDRYTSPEDYKKNLIRFVTETRSKRANPVLLSPVTRRRFKDGVIQETHAEYSTLAQEVANELNVPFIDLDGKSRQLLQCFGEEQSRVLFLQLEPGEHPNYPDGKDDNTHFSELGARKIAQLVLSEIRALKLDLAERIVKPVVKNKVIAFPGAEGFGKYTSGGREGKVYVVTNLNDDGPGSLREAVKKSEPRTVVFAVSGNVDLQSPLNISKGDLTIAGQSAPGDGICIRNYPVTVQANNVIIRFMRFRLGDLSKIESDAFGGTKHSSDIMIDHCSISWATDECASFYRNKNFTMQWCIISESLNNSVHVKGEHGYGGIWGGQGASFHHNILAHHTSRLPRFSGSSTTPNAPGELVDFRNNVVYNWVGNSTYGGEKGRYNVVNNYYKPGPATKPKNHWMVNPTSPIGSFYIHGNILEGNAAASADNWNGGVKVSNVDSARVNEPFSVEAIPDQSAKRAYEYALKFAGASLKRDAVDTRIIKEITKGTASFGKSKNGIIDSQTDVGGWPALKSLPAPKDSDHDGMPDDWETKHKLDPENSADAKLKTIDRVYTNLERYLNDLCQSVIQ